MQKSGVFLYKRRKIDYNNNKEQWPCSLAAKN